MIDNIPSLELKNQEIELIAQKMYNAEPIIYVITSMIRTTKNIDVEMIKEKIEACLNSIPHTDWSQNIMQYDETQYTDKEDIKDTIAFQHSDTLKDAIDIQAEYNDNDEGLD